jgi:hypothetical protein
MKKIAVILAFAAALAWAAFPARPLRVVWDWDDCCVWDVISTTNLVDFRTEAEGLTTNEFHFRTDEPARFFKIGARAKD